MLCHLTNKLQLMGKFWVFLRVGDITTSRHIEIFNLNAICGDRRDMSAIGFTGPFTMRNPADRLARKNRHTIIAFFPPNRLIGPASLGKGRRRKMLIFGLRFLQTQHIDIGILQKLKNKRQPQPYRINIPRR